MPFFFQYLIKVTLSLAALYTFYFIVLRPLTFYQWNRFYLLCYALLSFVIPFINITPWIPEENMATGYFIDKLPVVDKLTSQTLAIKEGSKSAFFSLLSWDFVALLFIGGALVMLCRAIYQYLSLLLIKKKAVLLKTGDVEFYDVNGPISPFSFANAIFINSRLHTEEEFHRILEHEFVHVKQKHTIDIVVAELVCVFNWFNPFAWLIRKSIRQNLEFIADHNVLQGGVDPRQYQYLLLKVMGLPQYRIANNFSFSSLKKRIMMMNKMRTAKVHLVKFLFILPLLSLILLAFRDRINFPGDLNSLSLSGVVMNAADYAPLSNLVIRDMSTHTDLQTDDNGFFKTQVPFIKDEVNANFEVLKEGIVLRKFQVRWRKFNPKEPQSMLTFIGLDMDSSGVMGFEEQQAFTDETGKFIRDMTPAIFQKKLKNLIQGKKDKEVLATTTLPIVLLRDRLFVIAGIMPGSIANSAGDRMSMISLECNSVQEQPVFFLDGKESTIDEVNASISRIQIKKMETLNSQATLKKYGRDIDGAIDISTYSGKGMDTIPSREIAPKQVSPKPAPVTAKPATATVPAAAPKAARGTVAPAVNPKKPVVKNVLQPGTGRPTVVISSAKKGAAPDSGKQGDVRINFNSQDKGRPPLYMVDGVVFTAAEVEAVDVNKIASVEVLKDASATAIYGDGGRNGVVIISTKNHGATAKTVKPKMATAQVKVTPEFKGLLIVDGEISSSQQLSALEPNNIEIIDVIKGNQETNIPEALRKIPGIEVDAAGRVFANGKPVDQTIKEGVIMVTTRKPK